MGKDAGKRHSVTSRFGRRDILNLIGGTAVVSLIGCLRDQTVSSEPNLSTHTAAFPTCVVKPEQTEGPYFVDERLNRSDIRSEPSDGSVREGVPLQLVFQISRVHGGVCAPLSDAIVDVWHCDAQGIYSDVNDPRFNTMGKKFLRGYQVTDANGIAQFVTIYPGWYPGRTIHIHFKVRTKSASQRRHEFTSQLYFDDTLTDQVHSQPPYKTGTQRTLNAQDSIFQYGGAQLMLQLRRATTGYIGTFAIGLEQP